MKHEVFISYQTESLDYVEKLCSFLEKNSIKCWYGKRDISYNHAAEIPMAIERAKVFLLIVDNNVAVQPRPDILNELHLACERVKDGQMSMIPICITNEEYKHSELRYHVGRMQKVFLTNEDFANGKRSLLGAIRNLLGCKVDELPSTAECRHSNEYFNFKDEQEKNRLHVQKDLLHNYDWDVYENALIGKERLAVLDVGCNEGYDIMDKFGDRPEVSYILGIDINEDAVDSAQTKYGAENVYFRVINVEDSEFSDNLSDIMEELQLESFDLINVSMLLLHLKEPNKLLKKLRKFLKKGGMLVVRDIDDSLTFVCPDTNDDFSHAIQICNRDDYAGYRHSGKEVYGMLIDAGFKEVRLVKKGLDSSGLTKNQKLDMFDIYFSFIYEDTRQLYNNNPENRIREDDFNWIKGHYEQLRERITCSNVLYQLGVVTYTAVR
ncbi:MAG: methyltransferase domain-containing protein [Prevotellaceae bacterium]|nr:methyltransferase domain-containing protein [Prevotellaceae bacterium]